jgi:hypothetical protein
VMSSMVGIEGEVGSRGELESGPWGLEDIIGQIILRMSEVFKLSMTEWKQSRILPLELNLQGPIKVWAVGTTVRGLQWWNQYLSNNRIAYKSKQETVGDTFWRPWDSHAMGHLWRALSVPIYLPLPSCPPLHYSTAIYWALAVC